MRSSRLLQQGEAALRHGWLTILALSLGPAVSNGLARFAYGLILPAMRDDLALSYTVAGWINTANAIGYLVGAVAMFSLGGCLRPTATFVWGMAITSLALLASGFTIDLVMLSFLRLISGISGAMVFIAGAALVAAHFPDDSRRNALGITLYFAGGGLGILLSALTIPPLFLFFGVGAWRQAWIALGVVGLLFTGLCWYPARHAPAPAAIKQGTRRARLPIVQMLPSLAGYFFFGWGYVIYLTFIVQWVRDAGGTPLLISTKWSILGVGVILSAFLWRGLLAKHKNGVPLAVATMATAFAAILPLITEAGVGMILVSAFLFGISFFIAPSAITAFSRHNLPSVQWAPAIALYTILFAIGQTIGPVAAGWMSDYTGSLSTGLLGGVVILLLGGMLAFLQRKLP